MGLDDDWLAARNPYFDFAVSVEIERSLERSLMVAFVFDCEEHPGIVRLGGSDPIFLIVNFDND